MKQKLFLLAASFVLMLTTTAFAKCNISASGEVNILSNSFPVLEIISNAFKDCDSSNLKVIHKLNKDHKDELPSALSATKGPYELVQVSNSTITPLQADGLLLPLNDLVAKYRKKYNIEDSMLIKIDGKILSIAFQVNAQHLFYREDLLDKHNIATPTTYAEVLSAAKKLKNDSSIEFPLSGTYKSGWNLAQEFNNIFLSYGGQFFDPETGRGTFNSVAGRKSLALMKQLLQYMSPNALALDSTAVTQQFQQGQVAMATLWASRAQSVGDSDESKVGDKIAFASAPKVTKNAKAATTLWWDGFSIPKNADGDADVAFQVMMEGLKEEVVAANNDIAVWLRSNYRPSRFAEGAVASVQNGAPPYPMVPQIGLIHTAIGNNIGDYLSGKESAVESLKDAVAEYETSAKDKGYIQ
jgi:ABC-type glycerol-3-phosphate transport system substrate-binding protein